MALLAFLKEYRRLDEGQKAFLRRGSVKGTRPPAVWIDFFEELAVMDEHGDKARKSFGTAAIVLLIVAFVSLFVAVPAQESYGDAAMALPGGLAGLGLVCALIWGLLWRVDIPNSFRLFVFPFMRVLHEELADKEPVALCLDLRGPVVDEKLIDTQHDLPGFLSYPKVKRWFFKDMWLDGSCVLADGSRFAFSVTDHVQKREVTRRTARGKIKTKTKHKVKRLIEVTVGLNKQTLAVNAPVGAGAKARSSDRRDIVRVRDVQKLEGLDNPVPIERFLELVSRVYKAAGKPQGAG